MKNNLITEAYDLVRPSSDADERMLAEILSFSRDYLKRKNRTASAVKMFASVAACFLFVFAAVRFFGIDIASLQNKIN
ncbi:MAG: hypothetical protein IKS17_10790 [Firmicutes bacterium]|nr:hypothetical protein [Bacillota bacterium]